MSDVRDKPSRKREAFLPVLLLVSHWGFGYDDDERNDQGLVQMGCDDDENDENDEDKRGW